MRGIYLRLKPFPHCGQTNGDIEVSAISFNKYDDFSSKKLERNPTNEEMTIKMLPPSIAPQAYRALQLRVT